MADQEGRQAKQQLLWHSALEDTALSLQSQRYQ
jgi:hypothetical protein